MDYVLALLICVLPLIGVVIGYRMGRTVKIIQIKENQTMTYLEEPSYEDEEAIVPEVE